MLSLHAACVGYNHVIEWLNMWHMAYRCSHQQAGKNAREGLHAFTLLDSASCVMTRDTTMDSARWVSGPKIPPEGQAVAQALQSHHSNRCTVQAGPSFEHGQRQLQLVRHLIAPRAPSPCQAQHACCPDSCRPAVHQT